MKWLISLALLLQSPVLPTGFVPQASSSVPTVAHFVGDTSATFQTNPTASLVMPTNITSGNILFVYVAGGTLTAINTPTGCGLTYTAQGTPTTGATAQGIWTAPIGSTGACTVSISGASSGGAAVVGVAYEIAGGSTSGLVLSTYNTTSGCTSCSGATLSTSTKSLVLTFVSLAGSNTSITAPSPFSTDVNAVDNQSTFRSGGHFAQASTGSYSPTWTQANFNTAANVSIAIP